MRGPCSQVSHRSARAKEASSCIYSVNIQLDVRVQLQQQDVISFELASGCGHLPGVVGF